MNNILEFFATAGRGLEPLLASELRALGAADVQERRGGVAFSGELRIGYAACLWSRVATRILLPLARFPAPEPEALYAGVRAVDWSEHLSPESTLAVSFVSSRSAITHTQFGAQKVKDAVVDQVRDTTGRRPSVQLERPDVQLNVYVHRDEAQLALDLSGESLHRRGYRERGAPAPLKENLAAALLLRADWPAIAAQGGALLDPMCGSGTLPIEAAFMAADIAPGLLREYFGFLGWQGHVPALWRQLREEAQARREAGLSRLPRIVGYDADAHAVRTALINIERAGLQGRVHIERRALADVEAPEAATGLFIVNPPYGERLGDAGALIPLYGQIGDLLKQRFGGWQAAVFTGNPQLGMRVGLRPRRSYQLYNGPIECRLSLFDIRERPAAELAQETLGEQMLANRLRKNLRHLSRWARREGITNYRLYDADLPEYAVAVDLYRSDRLWVHVQEYAAPSSVDAASAGRRLRSALRVIPEVLEIPAEQMFFKVRDRQRGRAQYEKLDQQGRYTEVREGNCRLLVNFTDYLDTGLFLDHRPTRLRIAELAQGKRFLNLFCYTGAASVHAAAGGARATTSVDMSRTYLEWAERNLALNGFHRPWHELIQADCLAWLEEQSEKRDKQLYDLIFLDPPSFSNSKRMQQNFDVQRDYIMLLRQATSLLAPDGLLIFSNNLRRFRLDEEALPELEIREITRETIPLDFSRNPRVHHCFEVRRGA